ncbi:NUDIX domain-containing protein [Candidatus Woesearchaeota archaeon]|nr:NUDIX domain-containing protein [Candidatus Woesearchaeota archaeon]
MREATLCLLVHKDARKVLLGMKKRGFGKGNYNGFGGGREEGESFEEATIRELQEEIDVKTNAKDLYKVGSFRFYFPVKKENNHLVQVYLAERWEGTPKESEEMAPKWFDFEKIPYDKMWDADKYWLPLIMKGKKIDAEFFFDHDNKSIKKYDLKELDWFSHQTFIY